MQFKSQEDRAMISVETMHMPRTARDGLEGTRHPDVVNPGSTDAMMGEYIREPVVSRKDNATSSLLTHDPDLQREENCPTEVMCTVLRCRKKLLNVVK